MHCCGAVQYYAAHSVCVCVHVCVSYKVDSKRHRNRSAAQEIAKGHRK